jgi:hypothetical protein
MGSDPYMMEAMADQDHLPMRRGCRPLSLLIAGLILATLHGGGDAAGHGAPRISAGQSSPGNTAYPNGGMTASSALLGIGDVSCGGIDAGNGYAYLGTNTVPGQIIKVALGEGGTTPSIVGSITLQPGEDRLRTVLIDTIGRNAYVGTDTSPGRVVKVALGTGSELPSRVAAVTLDYLEDRLRCGVIDRGAGNAYFGTFTWPGRVVKVSFGFGGNPPIRVGSAVLSTLDEGGLGCAVLDSGAGYAYFGANSSPGHVVKIALGTGSNPPTRMGSCTLNSGENCLDRAAIDTTDGAAYFGSRLLPALLVKVSLGSGSALPSRAAGGTLDIGDGNDQETGTPTNRYMYVGTDTSPRRILRLNLNLGGLPNRIGALPMPGCAGYLRGGLLDVGNGFAYLPTAGDSTGDLRKVALSQRGFIKGTSLTLAQSAAVSDVRFYSHTAAGNVRLAIYSAAGSGALLWQSGSISNTATNSYLTAPIASGTPSSLTLPPGTYWLAWQVDTTSSVPSFATGSATDSFMLPQGFSAFPTQVAATGAIASQEVWTEYINFTPPSGIEEWMSLE